MEFSTEIVIRDVQVVDRKVVDEVQKVAAPEDRVDQVVRAAAWNASWRCCQS